MQKIVTNLWFDGCVEEAQELYSSLLPDSRILSIARYNEAGMGSPSDTMTADFELAGQQFTIIKGGRHVRLSPARSAGIWTSGTTLHIKPGSDLPVALQENVMSARLAEMDSGREK